MGPLSLLYRHRAITCVIVGACYLPYLRGNVEDASFIRLKEVTLSYYLPEQWLRSIRLQKAKVFVQARDLGMVWTANKNNYDPEWLPGTNKPSTSFTFGASFNF